MSASDTVFAGVVGELEKRRLVPGQRLVEADLAATYGVSRNSVREALQRLSAEGIVDLFRHRGAAIRVLSEAETLDVLEIAERMTGLLARAAARGVSLGADGRELSSAVSEVTQLGALPDPDAASAARRGFYRALLALAGSRELRRLFPAIQMPIVYAQYPLPALWAIRLHDYPAIAKKVLGGDESGADLAGMAHVCNVREEILKRR